MSTFSFRAGTALDSPGSKREYNRRLFGVVAPRYDLITRLLSWGRDGAWKEKLMRLLPRLAAPRCLDVACGTGDLARLLLDRYPDAEIVGVDLSEAMLERARLRCTRIRFEPGDMNHLPVGDGSIDIVTGGYALRNAPDLPAFILEVRRVLRPGGFAAFLDFSRSDVAWVAGAQKAVLRIWGGLWGLVFHRDPHVYAYIAESLSRFPARSALLRQFERSGFRVRASLTRFFGMIDLTVVELPKDAC